MSLSEPDDPIQSKFPFLKPGEINIGFIVSIRVLKTWNVFYEMKE